MVDAEKNIQEKYSKLEAALKETCKEILSDAKIPEAQTMLQRQIAATDKEIARIVYELYGMTEEEIKIVEGS